MVSYNKSFFICAIFLIGSLVQYSQSNPYPQIEIMGGYDILGVCVRNCAQCKTMFGTHFNGQLCAESCIKFNGKIIPDCEDLGSITPYLNRFE